MKLPGIRRALAIVPFVMIAACDTGTEFRSDLDAQLRAREEFWAQNGSASYSVRIQRACQCTNQYDVRLVVVDSVAVSGEHIASGDPLTATELAGQLTLQDLFDVVRDGLDREVPQISVSYNPDYGFVQFLYIDYDYTKLEDDVEFTASEYVAN